MSRLRYSPVPEGLVKATVLINPMGFPQWTDEVDYDALCTPKVPACLVDVYRQIRELERRQASRT